MKRFAVIGNPIGHSKSPQIHALFAEQFEHDIAYSAVLSHKDEFQKTVMGLIEKGYTGCNVTLPFKEEAFKLATKISDRAKLAEAVNTLSFIDEEIVADNTDGQGLVEDLHRASGSMTGKSILLIGAGGAAKGCVYPLLKAGVSKIIIVNRTVTKAENLAHKFSDMGIVDAIHFDQTEDLNVDMVINSTSSSIDGSVPEISGSAFLGATLAYDMFYQDELTSFEKCALDNNPNINTMNGLGMLVGQAAESYRIWNGLLPDISKVIEQLKF